jgi:peptidoglycan/LPS O-acetylase OafA/YrhL
MTTEGAPVHVETSHTEPRLRVLDAFRAIAILAVLIHHYLSRYAPPDHVPSLYGYDHHYPQWLDLGAMGVQFFFIISGFVIFMTLHACHHLFEFWYRRLARLYPAYVIAMAMTFVIANMIGPAEFHSTLRDALSSLAFVTPYVPGARFVEPAYWSLVVEIQFYVCIGLIYAFFRERFEIAWIACICAGSGLWLIGTLPHAQLAGSLSRYLFLSAYVPYFTAGIFFYQLYRRGGRHLAAMAAAALIEYVIVTPRFTLSQHLVSAAMIVAFVLFVRGRMEWLATPILVFVGGISYSLYLLHQYIGVAVIRLLKQDLALPDLVTVSCAVLMCAALAYALARFVEIPAKRTLLRIARARIFPRLDAHFPRLSFIDGRADQPPGNSGPRRNPLPARMIGT